MVRVPVFVSKLNLNLLSLGYTKIKTINHLMNNLRMQYFKTANIAMQHKAKRKFKNSNWVAFLNPNLKSVLFVIFQPSWHIVLMVSKSMESLLLRGMPALQVEDIVLFVLCSTSTTCRLWNLCFPRLFGETTFRSLIKTNVNFCL